MVFLVAAISTAYAATTFVDHVSKADYIATTSPAPTSFDTNTDGEWQAMQTAVKQTIADNGIQIFLPSGVSSAPVDKTLSDKILERANQLLAEKVFASDPATVPCSTKLGSMALQAYYNQLGKYYGKLSDPCLISVEIKAHTHFDIYRAPAGDKNAYYIVMVVNGSKIVTRMVKQADGTCKPVTTTTPFNNGPVGIGVAADGRTTSDYIGTFPGKGWVYLCSAQTDFDVTFDNPIYSAYGCGCKGALPSPTSSSGVGAVSPSPSPSAWPTAVASASPSPTPSATPTPVATSSSAP